MEVIKMNYIDLAKSLISNGEVKEASSNIFEDAIDAILGNPASAGKIMIALAKLPFFIREQIFWTKLQAFLNGVYLNEDDRSKLCAKLMLYGEKNEGAFRLIEYIDRAETQQKIKYLINATRCLFADFIDLSIYFRICHAVTHCLEEDLRFLKNNIGEENFEYSLYIQGLFAEGLMYQSVIGEDGRSKYSFTPLARMVDQYAVSYDDVVRYPSPVAFSTLCDLPNTEIPSLNWQELFATDEEVKEMIDQVFGKE